MEIMEYVTQLYMPIVLVACMTVGYVIKKWINDVDNKYIPTIVFILGAILGCVATQTIDIHVIVAGAVSGLASTGLHQAFSKLLEKE